MSGYRSIRGGGTTFSISAGSGIHIDPITRVITPISWTTEFINLSVPDILTQLITFISIDKNKNIIYATTRPDEAEDRNYIFIGVVVHVDNLNIDDVNNEQSYVLSPMNQIQDLYEAIGFINLGNFISDDGTNSLQF